MLMLLPHCGKVLVVTFSDNIPCGRVVVRHAGSVSGMCEKGGVVKRILD